MRVIGGNEETPLIVIRPCRMEVLLSRALDMNGSPHLIIGYLLKGEHGGLGAIIPQSIG